MARKSLSLSAPKYHDVNRHEKEFVNKARFNIDTNRVESCPRTLRFALSRGRSCGTACVQPG